MSAAQPIVTVAGAVVAAWAWIAAPTRSLPELSVTSTVPFGARAPDVPVPHSIVVEPPPPPHAASAPAATRMSTNRDEYMSARTLHPSLRRVRRDFAPPRRRQKGCPVLKAPRN